VIVAVFLGLIIIGGIADALDGEDESTTSTVDSSTTVASTSQPSTTEPPATTATTTAPETTQPPETSAPTTTAPAPSQFEEVVFVPGSIRQDDYFTNWFYATVEVTNHSSKRSEYSIDYACYSSEIQVDDGFTFIDEVEPGVTAREDVRCEVSTADVVDHLRITDVERDEDL
jgi:hypothetical protein